MRTPTPSRPRCLSCGNRKIWLSTSSLRTVCEPQVFAFPLTGVYLPYNFIVYHAACRGASRVHARGRYFKTIKSPMDLRTVGEKLQCVARRPYSAVLTPAAPGNSIGVSKTAVRALAGVASTTLPAPRPSLKMCGRCVLYPPRAPPVQGVGNSR